MALKVNINGKNYEAENGEYVLEVCRRNRVLIPTLCHHESLSGLGSCRLCVVEVNEGGGNKVVVSCVYPLSRDCEVFTESEKIKAIRRTILSMLKTRAPAGDRLASLCQIYGVEENRRFSPPDAGKDSPPRETPPEKNQPAATEINAARLDSSCALCGLCVQACASLGTGAISTVGRGVAKKISTPYEDSPADCIGCGSCAAVCPTKAIECTETEKTRSIWGREFTLLRCASCGSAFATEEEYAFALAKAAEPEVREQEAAPRDADTAGPHERALLGPLCDMCRRKKGADVLAEVFGARKT